VTSEFNCWNCGKSIADVPLPISRHANCPHCFEVLHCCRLCQFYVAADHTQCTEDRAEPPSVKESANFCEYFSPTSMVVSTGASGDGARARLESLFDGEQPNGEPAEATGTSDAKTKLDDLFDD
jgi:hypothetical protein